MSRLRDRLAAFGIRPKRGLGQNFLHDPQALEAIARAVGELGGRHLVEIGPGPGTLTERLLDLGRPLLGIEKDPELVRLLRSHFGDRPSFEVRAADVLEVELSEGLPEGARPTVVGNIPYNISSPIVLHLLAQRDRLGPAVLMLQAELAQRLRAPVGSRASGSLTVLLALLAKVDRVLRLPAAAFFPPPKVSSEVIRIVWRDTPAEPVDDLRVFERTVRLGFAQRRKTLRNALGSGLGRDRAEAVAEAAGVDLGRRAETLGLGDWARLANAVAASDGPADPGWSTQSAGSED